MIREGPWRTRDNRQENLVEKLLGEERRNLREEINIVDEDVVLEDLLKGAAHLQTIHKNEKQKKKENEGRYLRLGHVPAREVILVAETTE